MLYRSETTAPLAVGSAFKLLVLAEYEKAVAEGRLKRTDIVTLEAADKSLPTGILQNWPVGTPLTLDTVAGLMISVSDNTATDMMIGRLGRSRLERLSPNNVPFLKTSEAFKMKTLEARSQRVAYVAGDETKRRRILQALDAQMLPKLNEMDTNVSHEVEWFFREAELCDLIVPQIDAGAFVMNPGPVDPTGWSKIAYKGGSETGVLNLTAAGQQKEGGEIACVSFTVNDSKPIANSNQLMIAFARVFSSLLEQ